MQAAAAATQPPMLLARTAELLRRLRAEAPRVHVVTNTAAQAFSANLLLAAGAVPSLTTAPEEVAAFVESAAALVINLGTLDGERRAAIPAAIAAAKRSARPWLLDPVFVEASPLRLAFARACLAERPALLRCNAAELAALAGAGWSEGGLAAFAREAGTVVAVTGATDLVSDGRRSVQLANGHVLMTRVTAMGCAGTALIGAFAALTDGFEAAAAGLLTIGIAAEIAAQSARGPGTFATALLDALYALDDHDFAARARLA